MWSSGQKYENKIQAVINQKYPLIDHIVFLSSVSADFVSDICILNTPHPLFFKEIAKRVPAKHPYFMTYCMLKNLLKRS